MGNYASSCTFQSAGSFVDFVASDGTLRRLDLPAKAADLMLECPGHVVSPADETRRTCRVAAMRADDELKPGRLYLTFPSARAGSRVSGPEMTGLDQACRNRRGKERSSVVFPVEEEKVRVRVIEGESDGDTGFPGHRLNNYRYWRPALETIEEAVL